MPTTKQTSAFLKPLEPVRSSDKSRLTPNTVSQLKSLARQVQDRVGQIAVFTDTSDSENSLLASYLEKRLNRTVYRVDISSVVSKYIGETEKNLSQVFDKAEELNAVLLFDEADSLFGKRTEVNASHDRYANMETNYLLERIERHPGLVILTSNQRSNLDDAMLRRAKWVIDFTKPK